MPRYHFKIKMNPVPKQYQRVSAKAGQVWAYTPANVIKAQREIASFIEGCGAWFPEQVGVRVTVTFCRPEPTSPTMVRIRKACEEDGIPVLPVISPDIDNYFKTLADALSGKAYADDSQITEMRVRKRFGEPSVVFTIEEDTGELDD